MKRLIVVLMMLCPLMAIGQGKTAKKFPLTVHVVSSRLEPVPENWALVGNFVDILQVTIESRRYVLAALVNGGYRAVLVGPGNYAARLKLDKSPNPGEFRQTYELRLANGKTVPAYLWGMDE